MCLCAYTVYWLEAEIFKLEVEIWNKHGKQSTDYCIV